MKVTLDIHARITPVEEIIRNDGGIQVVPPGQVIVELGGAAFYIGRPRFEALAPDAVLDAETMIYRDADTDEVPRPPSESEAFLVSEAPRPNRTVIPGEHDAVVAPEPPVDEPGPDDTPPEASVAKVLEWVGDDRQRAAGALAAEQAQDSPRSTLVDALEKLLQEPAE